MLGPDTLLLAEDRGLLRKHRFVPGRSVLFAPASLSGSRLTGGFMRLDEVGPGMARAGGGPVTAGVAGSETPALARKRSFAWLPGSSRYTPP